MRKLLNMIPLLALAVALAATFGMVGCGGGNGDPDCADTPDTPNLCSQDDQCHECCDSDHCADNEYCDDDFVCKLDCEPEDGDCSSDRGVCCDGLACDVFYDKCVAVCTADEDCPPTHEDVLFNEDLLCQAAGYCDFKHCSSDANCEPGTVCYIGDCVTPVDCSQIDSCKVVPASAVTQLDTEVALSATAFMTSGAMAPGVIFEWTSDNVDIAAVADGVVTGGTATGTATITARVAGCTDPEITSDASVLNYGEVILGTRVAAIDEMTGQPIEGITVEIEGAAAAVVTDALGVAQFDDVDLAAAAATVTLSHAGYGYVSFVDAGSNDLIAHLGEIPDPDVAGGYQGHFDFSKIICGPDDSCEISLGLTGASIPGNLFNLNLDVLIGELLCTDIELGGTSETVPLPGGLVICLNDTCFKEDYRVTGVEGTRVAWALGGKLNLADVIEILGPIISDPDNLDIGEILGAVLPLFAGFNTAVIPNVEIVPILKVADADDINCDEDTSDLVPDYANFPELESGDMVLKIPMDKTLTVDVDTLPSDGADGYLYDGVIVLGGVLVRDAGLVPLGLSAGMDAPTAEDVPDGQIDSFELKLSDVAGRLPEGSYQRAIVVLALNIGKLSDSENTDPMVIAGQVHLVDQFDGTLNVNNLMGPAEYTFDPESANPRQVNLISVPAGIDYVLMLLSSDAGSWQVLHPGTIGLFDLPDAPVAGDRAAGMGLVALKLAGDVTYQDLIEFNGTNMNDLVSLVSEFVIVYAGEGGGLDISCATGASRGCLPALTVMLLGLALLLRRRR